jgi:DNA-binding XRE family transcriptional regulator
MSSYRWRISSATSLVSRVPVPGLGPLGLAEVSSDPPLSPGQTTVDLHYRTLGRSRQRVRFTDRPALSRRWRLAEPGCSSCSSHVAQEAATSQHGGSSVNTVQGDRVRAARQEAQLMEYQLAAKLGIPKSTLVAIEEGQREASFEEADAIARATGANIFDLYKPTDGLPVYQGNRSKLSGPITGHDFEALTLQQQKQRELDGWSEREQELAELAAIEEWDAHASPEARRAGLDRIRRRNDLRQKLLLSPTGERVAAGAMAARPQPPSEPADYFTTSHGPQPVEPVR